MATQPLDRFAVSYPGGAYEYSVGIDLLGSFRDIAGIEGPTVIVTDTSNADRYLPSCGEVDLVVVMPTGRDQKTLAAVQMVHRRLLDARMDRSATIVSLGDSIVSDVAAFAAATYLRGIALVHLPTELIAMIDTSIGGKVGLDVPHGRNLIGLFKHPAAVVADVATLQGLTPLEFSAGMAEVSKHALIDGSAMVESIESESWAGGSHAEPHNLGALRNLVASAAAVKIGVVEEDPYDENRRQVLNLGHTFAYAFESATLGELSHGEAVGLGLVGAARLSERLDLCDRRLPERVESLVSHIGLDTALPRRVDLDAIDEALSRDKKRRGSGQRFVLLEDVGAPLVSTVEDGALVRDVVESLQPTGRGTKAPEPV